ncbi:uncharacterized protein DEA37_0008636 [Paragonimus westermani]|uniref:Clathrin light chain n=1 Tax=Paragonimus westermani TaxID=34504 RepID=A0A5J4NYV7_9TREM|nr:uncharacterized protein DEA37_0008636 [Paragonimus westermani]
MSEIDPVSDFLTREQEALGDLSQELRFHNQTAGTWSDDPFGVNSGVTDEPGNINSYIMLNGDDAVHSNPTLFSSDMTDSSNFPTDSHSQGPTQPNGTLNGLDSSVHTVCETWREEYNKRIQQKDAEEERLLTQLKEAGSKELENWQRQYEQQKQLRAQELREKQNMDGKAESMNSSIKSKPSVNDSAVWAKVCDMCDFQAKQKNTPDLSRMRGILLSLKPS